MSVVESDAVREQIKKHNEMLEAYQLFTYALKYNGKMYYKVRYSRFHKDGSATGFIILTSDGTVVPKEEAAPVLKQFAGYNACIESAVKTAHEKDAPVEIIEELQQLLKETVLNLPSVSPSAMAHIHQVMHMVETTINCQYRLKEIHDEMTQIDTVVQIERKYVVPEEVIKINNLSAESHLTTYKLLRISHDSLPSIKRLRQFCRQEQEAINGIKAKAANRLVALLGAMTNINSVNTLKRSLQRFERDERGMRD